MLGERYDPVANPYAPGAGTPPPELVGRDAVIDAADIGLQRLLAGRSTQHHMLTGLRGTGKTVLLRTLASVAESLGFRTIRVEAISGDDTLLSLLRQAHRILDDFDDTSLVRRAATSITSVRLSLGAVAITAETGVARPDPEALSDVIVDLAAAAHDQERGVALAIDEAQLLPSDDLRRILAGIHRCGQDGLPLWAVLAGLPNLVGEVARSATYAERMFTSHELGALTPDQVAEAVAKPAAELQVEWSAAALDDLVNRSDGYAFFVQTWAYHTWNAASDEPISKADVERGAFAAQNALETAFFASRIARIPASEVDYVRGLASLGPGPHRSGDVAAALGKTTSQMSAIRDRLIDEGVIYGPQYGWVEFAIPHFDDYVRRHLPPLT